MRNMSLDKKPICDIIIITWNGLEYTKKCVESIEENTKNVDYRIIFVDNNSTDGTVEFLKQIKNSIILRNEENLGFAKAMNRGFEKVSAKYTVWLNNDTIVTSNWLKKLIDYLENDPKAGAIGPVSNGTGIIQKVEGLEENDYTSISEFGRKISKEFKNKVVEYHRIAGFCIVMKSELITKIGKLDETFNFGGYDDDDYCKRIRDAGYKILIANDVFIYHKSGATFSQIKDPDLDLSFLMQKSRRILLRKWAGLQKTKNNSIQTSKEPLVSVIMATKDREQIISRAINSVIAQQYKNWELIVVNDGGHDLTELIKKKSDSRIRLLNLPTNHGKSFANNLAIKESKGEIVAHLDDDDLWYPNHLHVAMKELTKNEYRQFVYTDYIKVDCTIDPSGRQIPIKKEVIQLKDVRSEPVEEINFIPNFCMVHRKSLYDDAGTYDELLQYYEDWDIIRRFSRCAYFVHIPEISGEYWINQFSPTRNSEALIDKNLQRVLTYIKSKNLSLSNSILYDLERTDKLVKLDELKKAFKIYKRILEKDPEFCPAIEGCADRKFTLRDYGESAKYWNKLIKLNPFNLHYYIRSAQNSIYVGDYQEAKKLLESALIISDDSSCYYLLQNCYNSLGNAKTAKFIKNKASVVAENINLKDIEEFLLALYNKSPFYRKLLISSYKLLRKLIQI